MKILVIITKGDLGGAQTHVLELCRALRDNFEFLVLIGGASSNALAIELKGIGVNTQQIRELNNSLSPFQLIRTVADVLLKVKVWKPDAIHVHSAAAGIVGRIAGLIAKTPVVYTVHGFAFKPQVPVFQRIIALICENVMAPLTSKIICVSQSEFKLTKFLIINKKKISVISNGIKNSLLRCDPNVQPVTVIMVARMAPPKRHDLFLLALVVLRKRGITLPRVVLAGGGENFMLLKEICEKNNLDLVEMPGDLKNIPEVLVGSQIFVLLSDHEGQPISIIEAMRAGLPIIASKIPGISSQISNMVDGYLTLNKVNDIANALGELLSNPKMRVEMGESARQTYEREYSVENMAKSVSDVYTDLKS